MITPNERRDLKSRAHHLRPVVMVGQKGITDELIAATDRALADHELIKIKFIEFKEERRELADEIVRRTASDLVAIIGNVAILYREGDDKE